jgi:methylmalonyl-CoA/ethylmalonyl-CoA epimerase
VTLLRRLDHVAIAVRDTEEALRYFRDHLGLPVARSEEIPFPHVRLTYLDTGNAFIQLVEPLEPDLELARWIEANGDGLHHICFGVDDVPSAVRTLAPENAPEAPLGSGRGRVSAFVPGGPISGVRVECTEFDFDADVDNTRGWLE